ncbi:plasmid segregation protein ParM domain-containing protein, partial [Shigella flexneri]
MNVYCDDGSTTIKLAWNDNGKICKSLSQNSLNRPGFPGECFICELRLPDHRFRWK